MCGIVGYFSNDKPISGSEFYYAHSKMANRGPDDEGFHVFQEGNILDFYGKRTLSGIKARTKNIEEIQNITAVLGQVRLAIIDLKEGGHQPLMNSQKKISMVFNGEIYNYKELRTELEKKNYVFKTTSDTEVLFYAYQEWGCDCFNKLNGMWAAAFYDIEKERLILSRDRFGVKPLFYRNENGTTVFASAIKVITAIFKENYINNDCVKKYLEDNILCNDENTLIQNIYEVPPGCTITFIKGKKEKVEKYWNYYPNLIKLTRQEALDQFECLFRDSIRLRMRSDVEVGSLLSGGLDSNVIAGTLFDEGLLTNEYKTFSSVYRDETFSEKKYIEKTVEKIGVNSDLLYMTPEMVMNVIDDAIYNLEMPTRAVPMMLQYLLYQRISQSSGVKVVLNGQGADELFGGYNIDYMTRFLDLWYQKKIPQLFTEIKEYQKNRGVGIKQILCGMYSQTRTEHKTKKNAFNEIAFHQITETPLREYLMYDDRAAMSFGIENRAPFLDYRIVEFAYSLNSDLKVNKTDNKAIVRDFARKNNIIDETILNRKDKMGFVSPQEIWQKREWKQEFDEAFSFIQKNGLVGMNGKKYFDLYQLYLYNKKKIDWADIWRIYSLHRWEKIMGECNVRCN